MWGIWNLARLGAWMLGLATGVAGAQPLDDDAPPLYRVEVIVFAHNDADSGEEWFAHEVAKTRRVTPAAEARPTPRIVGSDDAASGGDGAIVLDSLSPDELDSPNAPPTAQEDAPGPGGELDVFARDRRAGAFRFRLLEDHELALGNAYGHIARLSAYRPLVHGGWLQQGLPESQAAPFDLIHLGASNPRGTIKLHLSRFLHVTVDLDYWGAGVTPNRPPSDPSVLGEISTTPRYPLRAQRRLRSGELHYIDHPMFGVLVLVTPEERPPETESEDDPQTPAA